VLLLLVLLVLLLVVVLLLLRAHGPPERPGQHPLLLRPAPLLLPLDALFLLLLLPLTPLPFLARPALPPVSLAPANFVGFGDLAGGGSPSTPTPVPSPTRGEACNLLPKHAQQHAALALGPPV
jgi:hypothetical protein